MIQVLKMALRSIGSNKLRSALTMLGIIIGVMALVVLVSLVRGATSSVTDAVSDLGSNLTSVQIFDDKDKGVHLSDLQEWMSTEPSLKNIAPMATDNVSVRYGAQSRNATLNGTNGHYAAIQGLKLSMGRFIKNTDLDNDSRVCVVNKAVTDLIGYEDCVGETLIISDVPYTVIGILDEDKNSLTSFFSAGQLTIYVPYTSLIRLSSTVTESISTLYIGPPDIGSVEDSEKTIKTILTNRFDLDEDAFYASSQNVIEETMGSITQVLTVLLGGIAAISLIVGGIGIMNIMLVTVTERTREIGIRKAIGATRTGILTQFLLEAVVLCMFGCALGIFFSWGILRLISVVVASLPITFTLQPNVVALSVFFCFMIGVLAGLYPANKAAKMKPIDALHYGG